MEEFDSSTIQATENHFKKSDYPLHEANFGQIHFPYYVIPQEVFPVLPDFALRMTHTDLETGEVNGIFGVSDSVPQELRDYWVAHEYIEFIKIGINNQLRCVEAEGQVVQMIPDNLTPQYVARRITFFENLVKFFYEEIEKETGNYTKADLQEAQSSLLFLRTITKTDHNDPAQIKKAATDFMTLHDRPFYGDESEDFFIQGIERFMEHFKPHADVVFYPGSSTHIGPSSAPSLSQSKVIYLDSDYSAVKALQSAGHESYLGDAEEFDPGDVDLLIILNFSAEKPLQHVKPGGYVICNNWWGTAKDLFKRPDFEIVGAVYGNEGKEEQLATDNARDFMTPVETDEEWKDKYPQSYEYTREDVSSLAPIETNLIDTIKKLQATGEQIAQERGYDPYALLPSIPYKGNASLIIYRKL